MAEEKKKKKKKGSPVILIVVLICLAVAGFSAYKLISTELEYKAGEKEYKELQQYTADAEDQDDEDDDSEEADPDKKNKKLKAPIQVDFESLQAINPDFVGWLYYDTLDLSYPVVQGEDNDFYLHRTFEKEGNFAGCLFVEAECEDPFETPNTIIYGHNMKNGTMFGMLKYLNAEQRYLEGTEFWILTPEKNYRYEIVSMQYTLSDSQVYTLFSGPGDLVKEYIEARQAESIVDFGNYEITEDSRVVTLSTCATAEGDERFVVQGLLMEED